MAKTPARTEVADAALIAGALLACYLVLGQDVFYKWDGIPVVRALQQGAVSHDHHLLYGPLLTAFAFVLRPLGLAAYDVAVAYSATLTAVGVFLARLGFARLGLDRARAGLAALACGTAPGVLFFATTVEFHGPLFAAAALAFVAMAGLRSRPTVRRGVALGAATFLCYLLHATGALVPALFAVWPLAWPDSAAGRRQLRGPLFAALVTHGALVGGTRLSLLVTGAGASTAGFLAEYWHLLRFDPGLLWREWLVPFAPWSVAMLWAPARAARRELLVLLVALVPLLFLCALLISGRSEHGAYLLPLALLAAAGAARALPRAVLVGGIAAGIGLGVRVIDGHVATEAPRYETFVRAARNLGGEDGAALITSEPHDYAVLTRWLPDLRMLNIRDPGILSGIAKEPKLLDLWVGAELASGKRVLVSRATVAFLRSYGTAGPTIVRHLESSYTLRRDTTGAFVEIARR